jgi:hypothetical protein
LEVLIGAVCIAASVKWEYCTDEVMDSEATSKELFKLDANLRPLRGHTPLTDVALPAESWALISRALKAILFEYEGRRWREFTIVSPKYLGDIDNSRGLAEEIFKKISN